jgi:putative component of membrane protein insertase Oxa1/YidC/SpoIIIJ protein YidD
MSTIGSAGPFSSGKQLGVVTGGILVVVRIIYCYRFELNGFRFE